MKINGKNQTALAKAFERRGIWFKPFVTVTGENYRRTANFFLKTGSGKKLLVLIDQPAMSSPAMRDDGYILFAVNPAEIVENSRSIVDAIVKRYKPVRFAEQRKAEAAGLKALRLELEAMLKAKSDAATERAAIREARATARRVQAEARADAKEAKGKRLPRKDRKHVASALHERAVHSSASKSQSGQRRRADKTRSPENRARHSRAKGRGRVGHRRSRSLR